MTKEMKAELIIQISEELEYREEGKKLEDPMMMVGNNLYFSQADLKEILKLIKEVEPEDGREDE